MSWISTIGSVSTSPSIKSIENYAFQAKQRFGTWLRRRRQYISTLNELSACSDMELKDMGIARCNINFLASQAADQIKGVEND